MKKVAVLVVHGIGLHGSSKLEGIGGETLTELMNPELSMGKLKAALKKHPESGSWEIELANWGEKIEPHQRKYAEATKSQLRWNNSRRVIISALGDAAQYQAWAYSGGKKVFAGFETIHGVVRDALRRLADRCGDDAPLVVVGHSLGAHILSNHIWDEQRAVREERPSTHGCKTALERMQTLRGFVSIGCNIPLFVLAAQAPKPIDLTNLRWCNYYDPDDVLGYPLLPLYYPDGEPKDCRLHDIEVEVGSWIYGKTPLSHGYYWDNPTVADGIARMVREAAVGG